MSQQDHVMSHRCALLAHLACLILVSQHRGLRVLQHALKHLLRMLAILAELMDACISCRNL